MDSKIKTIVSVVVVAVLQLELRRRVDEFFRFTGRQQRDCWQMYVKTAVFLCGFGASY